MPVVVLNIVGTVVVGNGIAAKVHAFYLEDVTRFDRGDRTVAFS